MPQRYLTVGDVKLKHRRTEGCCRRHSKTVLAGFDASGVPVTLDVGACRKSCNPRMANIVRDKRSSCSQSSPCEPSRVSQEEFHLVGGPVKFEAIDECKCRRKSGSCERISKVTVFRPGTPYETEVDVGDCSGQCRNGNGCKPQRNRTVTVPGPNGAECIEVIEECACASECYRMSKTEVYLETDRDGRETTRRIDVGLCTGDCAEAETYQCVFRSKPISGRGSPCLMSLKKRATSCLPLTYTTHEFEGDGKRGNKTVLAIRTCGCA
ncbi:uncharacterized protein LOC135496882 [Lineus longissimus]|uniref:uncharacterized protein LOC135496882 n=1 Tax=Lineus longissimus TaxID=88925 RepID=UPI00315D738A